MKNFLFLILCLLSVGITRVNAQKKHLVSDTTLAREWYEQGLTLQQTSTHDSANVFFGKAAKVYKSHQQWEQYLACENKIARGLVLMGKYDEALQRARQIQQESQDKLGNSKEKADALHIIGVVYLYKGDFSQALEFNQKALLLRGKLFGDVHPSIAASYSNIGNVYFDKGEYDQALIYTQKALELKLKILGENHPDLASTYNTVGNIYSYKGELDKALEYNYKALHLWQQAWGETHRYVAAAYNNIGGIYQTKGEYDKALAYYQKNLRIILTTLGQKHAEIAIGYYNIGNVYIKQGEYDQALQYLLEALEIRQYVFGKIHDDVAESYNSIGNVYYKKGEYDKALEYYQKDLQIILKTSGRNHPSLAATFNVMGAAFVAKGEYISGLNHYQQAILANTPSFHDTTTTSNPILSNKASIYLDGNYLLTSLQSKASTFEKLFRHSQSIQNLRLAFQTYCTADTLVEQIGQNFSMESDKVGFTQTSRQIYQAALPVCLRLHQLTQEKYYLDKAFYFTERSKASVLMATLAESKAKIFAGIADSLLTQDLQLRSQIAAYSQQVAQELTSSETTDSTKLSEYQALLFSARRRHERLVSRLEEEYPQYYKLKYQQAVITPARFQAALDEKTAIIEYVAADSLLHVFTLTRHIFDVQSIPLDSTFHRKIAAFREAILSQDEDLYHQAAYALYKILLPQAIPRSIRQLIIIPEGELTTLPFEALLTQNKKNKGDKSESYLLYKYAISYAYSARILYERLTLPKEYAAKQLLALAPVFADTLTNVTVAMNRPVLARHQPVFVSSTPVPVTPLITTEKPGNDDATVTNEKALRGWLLNGQYVSPLLASKREVESIAQLFRQQGNAAKIHLYNQACEEQLKSGDLSNYTYVHLATHGFINESYPELSGLLLAQDSTSREDGILYMGEIYNLRLQAELVTLSACETGLGKLADGEGVIGLTRALLYAGARNIVVSFWKVPDDSTASLMESFYAALFSSGDKALALQTAKRKMAREGKYTHPFYWAPFVLIGK